MLARLDYTYHCLRGILAASPKSPTTASSWPSFDTRISTFCRDSKRIINIFVSNGIYSLFFFASAVVFLWICKQGFKITCGSFLPDIISWPYTFDDFKLTDFATQLKIESNLQFSRFISSLYIQRCWKINPPLHYPWRRFLALDRSLIIGNKLGY